MVIIDQDFAAQRLHSSPTTIPWAGPSPSSTMSAIAWWGLWTTWKTWSPRSPPPFREDRSLHAVLSAYRRVAAGKDIRIPRSSHALRSAWAATAALKSALYGGDSHQPIYELRSMEQIISDFDGRPRRSPDRCPRSSPDWHSSWPPSVFMDCWRTLSSSGRAKLAFEWRWEPKPATCFAWWLAMG